MDKTIKSLLWLGTAVTFCLGAMHISFDFSRLTDETLRSIQPHAQIQKRSVAVMDQATNSTDQSIIYSGLHILFGLREWHEEGADVRIEGVLISPLKDDGSPGGPFNEDLLDALSVLDLNADYRADSSYNLHGELTALAFYEL